eukprot:gene12611-10820_t
MRLPLKDWEQHVCSLGKTSARFAGGHSVESAADAADGCIQWVTQSSLTVRGQHFHVVQKGSQFQGFPT